MKRPSIALAMIVKNELHNLPGVFESIIDCYDEIHITDTGSTDGTIEWLENKTQTGWHGAKVFLHHFNWIEDFAAARNYSFSHVKTDYVAWQDGDDVLRNKEAFIKWRDVAMELSDYWLATYDYGHDHNGKPVCSFARERVFKVNRGFRWNYFIHEGVVPKSPYFADVKVNYISTWAIKHKRTMDEMVGDRGRNLRILDKHKDSLDARMQYYYGKEKFDAGDFVDAIHWLMKGVSDPKCENHDRILGLQYAAYAYVACNQFEKAIQISHQGLQLDSNRAEFWVCIGDCYLKMGHPIKAIPAFNAARNCSYQTPQSTGGMAGMIFLSEQCYTVYPRQQLARIYANFGALDKAEVEATEAMEMGSEEAKQILAEVKKIKSLSVVKAVGDLEPTEDIIISCPPGTQMYEWDWDIAKERGIGGSETAAVQMAYWLKKLTNRNVKIFNGRGQDKVCEGVEYISNLKLNEYCSKYLPKVHIAWRHTIPITPAPTKIWSHDLITPGIEKLAPNMELMCLSPFHKDYAMAMQGVDESKVWITRNGIDPKRFEGKKMDKIYGQVMFPSSPDRGLDQALQIMDIVVKEIPEASLHVFYGFDNMRKSGMNAQADKIEAELKARPYVKFHGNIQQDKLAEFFMESEVWLYPASFIETFCITALEAMASKCYPIATRIGALQNTVGQFAEIGMADLFDERAETLGSQQKYAQAVIDAIKEQKWKKIDYPIEKLTWQTVAKEWKEKFAL